MKKSSILTMTLLMVFSHSEGIGQRQDAHEILFVNLKLIDGYVFPVDSRVVEGKLKVPKRTSLSTDRIYYEVLSVTNRKLYEGAIPDPSHTVYEYVGDGGKLVTTTVVLDSVSFSVRVPYDESIHKVNFYRVTDTPGNEQRMFRLGQRIGSVPIRPKIH